MSLNLMEKKFYKYNSLEEKLDFVKKLNKASEYELAFQLYLLLKDDFLQLKEYERVMDCLSGICQNLGNLGRVNEIEKYLTEYKMYCYKYGDDLAKLKLNSFIGYLSVSIEDYETAIFHYESAIAIASKLEDITKSTYLLINLQRVYLDSNKFEEAIQCSDHLKNILKEDRKAFSRLAHCAYLLNYMSALLEMNNFHEIPSLMKELEAVEGYEKLKREQMYANYLKGLYYEKLNDTHLAIYYLKKSFGSLEETKEPPYYKLVLKSLIPILKRENDLSQALFYSQKLIDFLDNKEHKKMQIKAIELSKGLKFDDMKELVYVDSLTNIHNRRYLEVQGSNWVNVALKQNSSLVCAMFDIDNFKLINDQLGHIAGDDVIKQIASQLTNHSEEDMLCARFGGDEFVVLARAKQEYEQVFRKLFESITSHQYEYNAVLINVDISMGVSSLEEANAKDLKGLIEAADRALYESKDKGKKRVTLKI